MIVGLGVLKLRDLAPKAFPLVAVEPADWVSTNTRSSVDAAGRVTVSVGSESPLLELQPCP